MSFIPEYCLKYAILIHSKLISKYSLNYKIILKKTLLTNTYK